MTLHAVQLDEDLTVISLEGKLDAEGVQSIESQFHDCTAARKKPAVVNMAGVNFMSSLGIRMLMISALALHKLGVRLVLLCPQELVERAFRATGMHAVIPIAHEFDKAATLARHEKPAP